MASSSHPPRPGRLRHPYGALLVLSFSAGVVEAIAIIGLFGFFSVEVGADLALASVAWSRHDGGWIAKTLALPTFFLTVAFGSHRLNRIRSNPRLASGYILFFEAMLLMTAMAAGGLGAPLSSPDAPAAVLAALLTVAAMALQALGGARVWRAWCAPISLTDFARLATVLGAGRIRALDRSRVWALSLRVVAFVSGALVGAMLWPLAGFWSLSIAATGVFVALFCFVPFDFGRAQHDIGRR